MNSINELKNQIYQIAAVTDRGQRLNKLIAPLYQEKSKEMNLYFMILLAIHLKGQGYIQMAQLINFGKGKKLFLKGLLDS